MIRNYIKVAWRNILRNKVNSFINIAGLAIGIASVVLISFYVQDELKYDRFFKGADHIYQVNFNGIENGIEFLTGNTGPAVGPSMVQDFPEIETYSRIYRPGDMTVRYEQGKQIENYFTEKRILAVDSNFLQLFSFEMLEGDPATCLLKPNSLVITEETAKKYFGKSSAIGKILLFDETKTPFNVTAVLRDIPSQSSLQFDMLAPIVAYGEVKKRTWNWFWLQVSTYVKVRENVSVDKAAIERLEAKFPAMVKKYAAASFESRGLHFDDFIKKQGGKLDFHLQPLTSVHLYSAEISSRLTTLGSIKYVYIFSIIALFIIILACVNFMNLSTAQSAKRAKEVGVRKVLGSERSQLIRQFLAEAMLYSFISVVVALLIVLLFLKPFNEVAGKSFDFSLLFGGNTWILVLGLFVFTGLLAGSYPAFYLTSFKPVTVLKGMNLLKSGLGNLFIRNGLVVFQFTISTALIICTIIVLRQLHFTQSKNLGLDKENVIIIANSDRLGNNQEAFRQELTKLPGVVNASVSSSIPTKVNFGDAYVPEPTTGDKDLVKEIQLASFVVDDDFIPTLQIQVLKGRNFARYFNDSASVILNESAIKQIGWKDPVGKYLQYPGNDQRFKVIAVTKDFNIESLRTEVTPFALFHASSKTYDLGVSCVSVRVKPGNMSGYLDKLERKWKSFAPNTPFDYNFLDKAFEFLYRSEKRLGTVFGIFTILSIFVACLGLFGLAAYTAERRTKEIGVRKILGATVHGIVTLLSKDFAKLVLVSAMIAFPIAWWAMNKWLQDFAYRIDISWSVFVIAGVVAMIIAIATVSFQAIKAAIANPVNSLRTE